MIKIALKHWIYEKCIDVLFKAIDNNFCPSHKQNLFRPGDRFSCIVIRLPNLYEQRWREPYVKIFKCTILDNYFEGYFEGTALIQFYAQQEKNSGLKHYGTPQNWRVNITDIINYDI